jgi:general secretion pathway protein G
MSRIAKILLRVLGAVVIIGVISFTLAVALRMPSGRWRETEDRVALVTFALADYHLESGVWPSLDEGLTVILKAQPNGKEPHRLDGRFLASRQALEDAWGRPLGYALTHDGCLVFSFGADRAPGGTGDSSDIVLSCTGSAR